MALTTSIGVTVVAGPQLATVIGHLSALIPPFSLVRLVLPLKRGTSCLMMFSHSLAARLILAFQLGSLLMDQ